ncbi:MAG: PKD domain-containing protein, partial [Planctomycetia bacterium]|nr:PKD domain-containing protein [Planctomycetia bacterium]
DTIQNWTINWGDGTQSTVEGNPSQTTHVFAAPGEYTISATATDEDGTFNANSLDVLVYVPQSNIVQGTPWLSGDPAIREGETYRLGLHAYGADILSWQINWGDGSTETFDGTADFANHLYADGDSAFNIAVIAVKNVHGTTENIPLAKSILVLNTNPVLTIAGPVAATPDNEYVLQLNAADPGSDTITQWTINWGDGFIETVEGNPNSAVHTYTNTGTYTIAATATDEDGTYTANSFDLIVQNVPATPATETPWISGEPALNEGGLYTLNLHANNATIIQWVIDWGDGSEVETVSGNATQITHLYDDGDENYAIKVSVTKEVTSPDTQTRWEGLTAYFWRNHTCDWHVYSPYDNYEEVFSVCGLIKPGMLIHALQYSDGDIAGLWRESTAALLNATHPDIDYRYSVEEVISMVQNAYATHQFDIYAHIFAQENYRGLYNNNSHCGGEGTTTDQFVIELEQSVSVRNVAPALAITGSASVLSGTVYRLGLSESDPGDDTIQNWTINWGDGTQSTVTGNPNEAFHVYETVGHYTITATATDEDGTFNANALDVVVFTPQTGPVSDTIWLSGDPAIYEGRDYSLHLHTGSAQVSSWQINWGDGTTETFVGNVSQATHRYTDGDNTYTIAVLAVKNIEGTTENVSLEKSILVRNVAPTLIIAGNTAVEVDLPYIVSLSSSDPGDDTIQNWLINWGDGTQSTLEGNPNSATHTYHIAGEYVITATATDEDGTFNANSLNVLVYVPQTGLLTGTPWISGDPTIYEGRQYALDLHANEATVTSWSINWGDGSEAETVSGNVSQITHLYADGDNTYAIEVTAVNQTGETTENILLEKEINVLNVAPTLVIAGELMSEIN